MSNFCVKVLPVVELARVELPVGMDGHACRRPARRCPDVTVCTPGSIWRHVTRAAGRDRELRRLVRDELEVHRVAGRGRCGGWSRRLRGRVGGRARRLGAGRRAARGEHQHDGDGRERDDGESDRTAEHVLRGHAWTSGSRPEADDIFSTRSAPQGAETRHLGRRGRRAPHCSGADRWRSAVSRVRQSSGHADPTVGGFEARPPTWIATTRCTSGTPCTRPPRRRSADTSCDGPSRLGACGPRGPRSSGRHPGSRPPTARAMWRSPATRRRARSIGCT